VVAIEGVQDLAWALLDSGDPWTHGARLLHVVTGGVLEFNFLVILLIELILT
jgi:hypothetical protein